MSFAAPTLRCCQTATPATLLRAGLSSVTHLCEPGSVNSTARRPLAGTELGDPEMASSLDKDRLSFRTHARARAGVLECVA